MRTFTYADLVKARENGTQNPFEFYLQSMIPSRHVIYGPNGTPGAYIPVERIVEVEETPAGKHLYLGIQSTVTLEELKAANRSFELSLRVVIDLYSEDPSHGHIGQAVLIFTPDDFELSETGGINIMTCEVIRMLAETPMDYLDIDVSNGVTDADGTLVNQLDYSSTLLAKNLTFTLEDMSVNEF